MATCEYCGNEIEPNSKFCPSCGAKVKLSLQAEPVEAKQFCTYCGAGVEKETEICMKCGCRLRKTATLVPINKSKTLRLIAFIFMLMGCIGLIIGAVTTFLTMSLMNNYVNLVGILFDPYEVKIDDSTVTSLGVIFAIISLVPLIWSIPMTIRCFKAMKDGRPLSTAFKVCTLIFVNLVAGILLLCDNTNTEKIDNQKH